jgi:hypothetical protein
VFEGRGKLGKGGEQAGCCSARGVLAVFQCYTALVKRAVRWQWVRCESIRRE